MKGETIPCPHCKGILIRFVNIKGEGTFETKCIHCGEIALVTIGTKTWITTSKVSKGIIAFLIIIGLFSLIHSVHIIVSMI